MACFNRNTQEYKNLLGAFNSNMQVDGIITMWQKVNNTDEFPSVNEARQLIKNNKVAFNLKQRDFGDALLANLSRKGYISKLNGTYYVNNSDRVNQVYDAQVLSRNWENVQKYLDFNNIPLSVITKRNTRKSMALTVETNMFTPTDMLEKSRTWDTTKSRHVVRHLMRMFPGVQVVMISPGEAKAYYDSLPTWQKSKAPFESINSFYNPQANGVVLIKGRVTDETLIEEMLHPFIDAVYMENAQLFNGLLNEAKATFPVLNQQIEDSYSDKRGFNQKHRNLELVTQALSRHFKKEYETTPTKSFLEKVKEFLDWFMNVINDLHKYLTGKPIMVKDINPNTKMSDIAKLLNTSDLKFDVNVKTDGKIRYSLTPELQGVVDYALSQSNSIQAEVIKKLFNQASAAQEEVTSLSAGKTGRIVVLNEEDHVYYDILDTSVRFKSTTARIKGTRSEEDMADKSLNIDLGKDFDKILEGLASDTAADIIQAQMKILNDSEFAKAYGMLQERLIRLTEGGGVAIPQVIVYDEATKTAGAIDLLIVLPDGKLRIVDLKTSKRKTTETYLTKGGTKLQWDRAYDLSDDSDLKKMTVDGKPLQGLSTRAQHGIQVNAYRRMLLNMGYNVDMSDLGATTTHIHVHVKGQGAEQEFTGKFEPDQWLTHKADDNKAYIDFLIPSNVDQISVEEMEAKIDGFLDNVVDWDKELDDDEAMPEIDDANPNIEFEVITQALENYKVALINKQKAMQQIKSAIYMDRTKGQTEENILNSISAINLALAEGPAARAALFTELTRDALRQVDSFIDYVKDPANVDKPEYITYVMNFNRFLKTFEGLHSIKSSEEINTTQRLLIQRFQSKLNDLGAARLGQEGIINTAINDYVKNQIKTWSSREDLTEDVLNDIINGTATAANAIIDETRDIGDIELNTYDLATSRNTILAIMDKIYKSKKQELLDKVETRNRTIAGLAARLQKLSPNKKTQEMYDWMLEFDDNGDFTGRYTRRLGRQYFVEQNRLRDALYDENGNPLEYINIDDLSTARKEDIEHNVRLAKAKAEYAAFWSAERIGKNDTIEKGRYHHYTDEFIKAREQHQYYTVINGKAIWKKKAGVSDKAYATFRAKYFNETEYTYAVKDAQGYPTGAIKRDAFFYAVKPEYRQANDYDMVTGESLLNKKYEAIMNPTDALGQARKEFYEAFVDFYENQMLKQIPASYRSQMLGNVPVIWGKLLNEIKGKPNVVGKLWAKTTRSMKNFVSETAQQRGIVTDEDGNLVDQLPVFFTGKTRRNDELELLDKQIEDLKDRKKQGLITMMQYDKEMAVLRGRYASLRSKPAKTELNRDMGNALMQFSAMAEHYETMLTAEDTYKAFLHVLENREYQPADSAITLGRFGKGGFIPKGKKAGRESNTYRRAKKWMSMVYYDNEQMTKGFLEKVADGVMNFSSATYVAFNPFGNFNNYAMGRINNGIEVLGGRFFSQSSYARASYEFNKRALPDLMHRIASATAKKLNKNDYDPELPSSKYEALVDLFRMMDQKSEIRETTIGKDPIRKSYYARALELGYSIQDAAEYNVQTKVGMSMIIDTKIMNKDTGEILSLYDAFEFDSETKSAKLKDGFTTIVKLDKEGQIKSESEYTDQFRYNLRNKIREVNKQIHGNYANDDRMVIQSHAVGRLATQFHKWVAPALKARFRREYFDENLGWMEGRYRAFGKFMRYSFGQMAKFEMDFANYGQGFMEQYGFKGDGSWEDDRAKDKLFGAYRTLGEIAIIMTTLAASIVLTSLFAEDDDDSDLEKRLENFLRYQTDRIYKELITFVPILGSEQLYQMMKSPIASTRTLGELGEALSLTIRTPLFYMIEGKDEFMMDSDFVYQRGVRAGELKLNKNWQDVVPGWYAWKKYIDFLNLTNFYIK